VQVQHVGFGVVLGEDGRRIKSRSGASVRLAELLDEAKNRCAPRMAALTENRCEFSAEICSETMGYGAVKYA